MLLSRVVLDHQLLQTKKTNESCDTAKHKKPREIRTLTLEIKAKHTSH